MARKNLEAVRQRCERLLGTMALPLPCTLDDVSATAATLRGRSIETRAQRDMAPTLGLWVATPERDVILYAAETTRLHQQHIILHELAHMFCGHRSEREDALEALLPDLDPRAVQVVLQRCGGYAAEDEEEAEVLASLIFERAIDRSVPEAEDDLMRRLEDFAGRG